MIKRDLALDDPAIYVTSRNCAAAADRLHTRPIAKPDPNATLCPHCDAPMAHVRTIAHLANLPDIHIFYCAPYQHVETIQQKRAEKAAAATSTEHVPQAGWT